MKELILYIRTNQSKFRGICSSLFLIKCNCFNLGQPFSKSPGCCIWAGFTSTFCKLKVIVPTSTSSTKRLMLIDPGFLNVIASIKENANSALPSITLNWSMLQHSISITYCAPIVKSTLFYFMNFRPPLLLDQIDLDWPATWIYTPKFQILRPVPRFACNNSTAVTSSLTRY